MIRGAIEIAQRNRVVGWMHAQSGPLRGQTVLAFVGGRCVGSGEVEGFRQDLLDAGLGDGFCGFDFPVRLSEGERVGSLLVRLQFSDAALLQQSSQVVGAGRGGVGGDAPDLGAMQPGRVAWLMQHGMLGQVEYDFLHALLTVGAYTRTLRAAKPGAGDQAGQRVPPEQAARELLSLVMMADTPVARTSIANLADALTFARAAGPVMALWSQSRGRLAVEERSHLVREPGEPIAVPEPQASQTYEFGPDRLLLLHRDCRFSARGPAPSSGLVVLTPASADQVASPPTPLQVRAA